MRSIVRVENVHYDAVQKLLVDAGKACAAFHDENVRGVKSQWVQCDEAWSFVGMKEKTAKAKGVDDKGDVWTWAGIDADSKLVISYLIGKRDFECAKDLMEDLKARLANRTQITTDGLKAYLQAVEETFGGDVDFAQLVKIYGDPKDGKGQKSSDCIGARKTPVSGNPNEAKISTSFIERQNLNIRMGIRQFTRSTNAFSKKIEHHFYALAIYFMYYNFCRIHSTLRITPAMAAGLTNRIWELEDILALIPDEAPRKRDPYKKKVD